MQTEFGRVLGWLLMALGSLCTLFALVAMVGLLAEPRGKDLLVVVPYLLLPLGPVLAAVGWRARTGRPVGMLIVSLLLVALALLVVWTDGVAVQLRSRMF
jgi:hypothetical protein